MGSDFYFNPVGYGQRNQPPQQSLNPNSPGFSGGGQFCSDPSDACPSSVDPSRVPANIVLPQLSNFQKRN
jgi:hypothetical protein